ADEPESEQTRQHHPEDQTSTSTPHPALAVTVIDPPVSGSLIPVTRASTVRVGSLSRSVSSTSRAGSGAHVTVSVWRRAALARSPIVLAADAH
ncbi:hypothetical protein, partial [Pseudomonas aeruginosa]